MCELTFTAVTQNAMADYPMHYYEDVHEPFHFDGQPMYLFKPEYTNEQLNQIEEWKRMEAKVERQ